jgi:uncharacterized protein YdhG (YjbR/CyaY superfamily)
MEEKTKILTIDEYIKVSPIEIQPKLNELRTIIKNTCPDLTEKMSWQMPTFYYKGNIIHFAANKKHIGLYPGVEAIEKFKNRLVEYKTSKGAIQIPNDKELDVSLIQDIVKYNINLK